MKISQERRVIAWALGVAVLALVVLLIVFTRGGDEDRGPMAEASPGSTGLPPSKSPAATRGTVGPTPSAPPVVSDAPRPTAAALEDTVKLANGVSIEVTDIESVKGVARGPGEVAGPALRFTVRVTNDSSKALDLDLAVVTAYSGRGDAPAEQLSGPGAAPLPQKLKVGDTNSGRYVFAVPVDERGRVRVDFSYVINQPTIIFRGPAT